MRSAPRILIYAAGVAGVGQTRRAVRLAEYLCSVYPAASVLVVSGIPDGQELFATTQVEVVSLAEVVALVGLARQAGNVHAVGRAAAAATSALEAALSDFDPDVFVSTTHAGLAGEVVPLLKSLGDRGRRRVLALRDVYWPVRFEEEFERLTDADFDQVIVGGGPATSRIPSGLLTGSLVDRVRFVGYLRPTENARSANIVNGCSICCHVGGGRDGYALAAALIEIAPVLRERMPSAQLQISTGTLMAPRERRQLLARAEAGGISVKTWISDPFGTTGASATFSTVISMAGYNTCVEAAWFGTPTVLSPRRSREDSEQEIRARVFAEEFSNISVLDRPDPDALMVSLSSLPAPRAGRLSDGQLAMFADPREVADLIVGKLT